MNYIEVLFECNPSSDLIGEVLAANLADIGYESFVDTENGLLAYVQEALFNADLIDSVISEFPLESKINYKQKVIIEKNWNEEWEKNYFQPLVIEDKCIVRSTFHKDPVDKNYIYSIYIDPKMSFGTGHHQTTELMIREILNQDFEGKTVLDMGCGTAILAILASMRGADTIGAIDIDEWAYENAKENLQLNNVSNVEVKIGGAELLNCQKTTYDIVLANINRNILLLDIHAYAAVLNKGGLLFMSGFYLDDIPSIKEECNKYGLNFNYSNSKDNWAVVKFTKA